MSCDVRRTCQCAVCAARKDYHICRAMCWVLRFSSQPQHAISGSLRSRWSITASTRFDRNRPILDSRSGRQERLRIKLSVESFRRCVATDKEIHRFRTKSVEAVWLIRRLKLPTTKGLCNDHGFARQLIRGWGDPTLSIETLPAAPQFIGQAKTCCNSEAQLQAFSVAVMAAEVQSLAAPASWKH